jgi:hypothetical protein
MPDLPPPWRVSRIEPTSAKNGGDDEISAAVSWFAIRYWHGILAAKYTGGNLVGT